MLVTFSYETFHGITESGALDRSILFCPLGLQIWRSGWWSEDWFSDRTGQDLGRPTPRPVFPLSLLSLNWQAFGLRTGFFSVCSVLYGEIDRWLVWLDKFTSILGTWGDCSMNEDMLRDTYYLTNLFPRPLSKLFHHLTAENLNLCIYQATVFWWNYGPCFFKAIQLCE